MTQEERLKQLDFEIRWNRRRHSQKLKSLIETKRHLIECGDYSPEMVDFAKLQIEAFETILRRREAGKRKG